MKAPTQKLAHRHKLIYVPLLIVCAVCLLPTVARAGNGTFRNGEFNFCVSVRFNATAAQLQQIRTAFQNASQILSDATDGQHRFGSIAIVNNSGASESAEYWVNADTGRAYATQGRYGVRGEHVMLYFQSDFQALNGADGDSYTIAHEHSHHAYGVLDEYSGPGFFGFLTVDAECKAPPDVATDSFCLMDNYFIRGGRASGGAYTLNEYCVAGNHDPDMDTYQQSSNGRSCWAQISAHPKRPATAPGGLPTDAPPAAHTVDFEEGSDPLRVVLVLDRSGSMGGERIDFAKRAANLFVDFLRDGDSVAVVSFSDAATVNFALTPISGSGTKASARAAINSLTASGNTNIGGGLQAGLNQLTTQTSHSCNNIIVLLSDGDHNTGPTPASVIPAIQDADTTVLSVGLGSGISSSGQAALQNVANQTGGRYFSVTNSFDLVGLFLRLTYESFGSGLLVRAPLSITTGQTREVVTMVEAGTASATFAVAIANQSDQITLSLRSPSGQIINEADAANDPNLELIISPNSRALRLRTPEPGNWRIVVTAGTVSPNSMIEVQAFGDHDGVQLNLSVAKDTLTAAESVQLLATPRFEGEAVTGATLTGRVTRPDGSSVFISLYDDGQTAHGDAVANDGIYSTRFNQYSGNGTYTFSIKADVSSGTSYSGEDIFSFAASNANPVPQFVREATTTAVVTGASTSSTTADLSIVKTASSSSAVPGATITYTLNVGNNGTAAATSVVVSDTLPPSTTFVSCAATGGGVCGGANNNRQITFASLANGASASITLVATVNAATTDPVVINTASVSSATADTGSGNNVSSATVQLPAARAVQFSASRYSAGEGDEVVSITVVRSGDTSAAATIDYTTADGTATQRGDYTLASGRLFFAPGETSKTINLLLNEDAYFEGTETIDLTLSNPTGDIVLGSVSAASLNITDNDTAPPAANPIDDAMNFVLQNYHDILNRQTDAGGLNYWTNEIALCGTDAACITRRRAEVSAAFFVEEEFQQTGFFLHLALKASYGSNPAYLDFMRDRSRFMQGTNVESDKMNFLNDLVQRSTFLARYPNSLSGVQFIDALLETVRQASGVTFTQAQRDALIADFNANMSRARILRLVTDNAAFRQAEYNPAFVLVQYFGYLRRDADSGGYTFWLDVLNNRAPNNYRAMVCAFITSREYQERFSSIVTRNNQQCQ
jgi:uncharacterized repeat protein (TIGR01451 family)